MVVRDVYYFARDVSFFQRVISSHVGLCPILLVSDSNANEITNLTYLLTSRVECDVMCPLANVSATSFSPHSLHWLFKLAG